jgi:hypothetical protein
MKDLTPSEEILFVSISILFIFGLLFLACITVYIDFINKDNKNKKDESR